MTSGNAVSTGEFDKLIQHLQSRAVLTPLAAQEGRMARVSSAEQDAGFTLDAGVTHRRAVDAQAASHALKPRRGDAAGSLPLASVVAISFNTGLPACAVV